MEHNQRRKREEQRLQPRQKRPQDSPKSKDGLFGLLCFQIGICSLGLALILASRWMGADSFNSVRAFTAALCGGGQDRIEIKLPENMPKPSLGGLFSQAGGFWQQFKEALSEAIQKNIAPPPENEAQPPPAIGESRTVQAVALAVNNFESPTSLGKGGWFPVQSDLNTLDMMQAPERASFSPYMLTAAIRVPITGQVSSDFGYRYHPITMEPDFHTGLDIAAARGAVIHAALPGTVEEAGWSDSYGFFVKLRHSTKLVTTYSHCEKLLVEAGENLSRGDRIALVGSTGIATGPHLHFEILIADKRVDPMLAIKQLYKESL